MEGRKEKNGIVEKLEKQAIFKEDKVIQQEARGVKVRARLPIDGRLATGNGADH